MQNLSGRLKAAAGMVRCGGTLADIGCDHAYIPIALLKAGRISRAIAADVRQGPLEIAGGHILAMGMQDRIELRQSDGFSAIRPGEADCAVITGMGGRLICRILRSGADCVGRLSELVLGPQSELHLVRNLLAEETFSGTRFRIDDEAMVFENGKYYTLIHAVPSGPEAEQIFREEEAAFGACLLKKKDPVLREFLLREKIKTDRLIGKLEAQNTVFGRIGELRKERRLIEAALGYYETE